MQQKSNSSLMVKHWWIKIWFIWKKTEMGCWMECWTKQDDWNRRRKARKRFVISNISLGAQDTSLTNSGTLDKDGTYHTPSYLSFLHLLHPLLGMTSAKTVAKAFQSEPGGHWGLTPLWTGTNSSNWSKGFVIPASQSYSNISQYFIYHSLLFL